MHLQICIYENRICLSDMCLVGCSIWWQPFTPWQLFTSACLCTRKSFCTQIYGRKSLPLACVPQVVQQSNAFAAQTTSTRYFYYSDMFGQPLCPFITFLRVQTLQKTSNSETTSWVQTHIQAQASKCTSDRCPAIDW